jgi:hypothetical protein
LLVPHEYHRLLQFFSKNGLPIALFSELEMMAAAAAATKLVSHCC